MTISYDGTNYCGWQRQKNGISVQETIERGLNRMTNEITNLHGAGRTDAGVHAEAMTAHFKTSSKITCKAFQRGLNSLLDGSIRIMDLAEVPANFHARFNAIGKKYRYSLFTGAIQPPHLRLYSVHVTAPLNMTAIRQCLAMLEGTHDFSSFENTGTRDKTIITGRGAVRTIFSAQLRVEDEMLHFEFVGDGFLRNMVRNLAGTLLETGRGKLTIEQFKTILEKKDRTEAGPTAPANGLSLIRVYYEENEF